MQQPAPPYAAPSDEINVDEKASDNNSQRQNEQPRGTTGAVTVGAYVTEGEKQAQAGYYAFRWSSLFQSAVINPINGKSHTFPILRFWDTYSTQFWLATLGEHRLAS